MAETNPRFSADYAEARARFRSATAAFEAGAFDLGSDLSIDWAWVGPDDSARVVLYTSGLHGVEGFGGGAAQLEALDLPAPDVAVLYVHALNPWGWANLRRVNEENVDLNRNFLDGAGAWAGAEPAYAALDGMLNPKSPPGGFEAFWLKVAWVVARHGYAALKNAVVCGQYEFPKGLFFGGRELQTGPRVVMEFLKARLSRRERVVHVDWHSALGARGACTALLEGAVAPEEARRVSTALGMPVRSWDPTDPHGYVIKGGFTAALARALPGVRYDGLTCEFGTLPNLGVLSRLRAENRLHHWGDPRLDHPAKLGMREAFAPLDAAWQAQVVEHARAIHAGCLRVLES